MKGLYSKRGWWYYQAPKPKEGLRPKAVALQTRDEAAAINAVVDLQWNGMIHAAETKDTLGEVLPRYYAAKGEDRKSTRRQRKVILDAFKDRMGNPRVTDITRQMILDWRTLLASTGGSADATNPRPVSQTTLTSYTVVLRAFLNWCVTEKILRKNPAGGMMKQAMVRSTRRQKFLTIDQRELLLKVKGDDAVMFILYFGFFAGLRIGEMLAMTADWLYIAEDWSHGSMRVQPTMIKVEGGTVALWEPKTHRGVRTIPLHPRLLLFLKSYKLRQPYMLAPKCEFFPNETKQSLRFDPRKAMASHAKKCGVSGIGYHVLRHSFGTHLAMGGAPMVEIAGLLGNTVKVAEDSYAGYSPRTNNLLPGV